MFQHKTIILFSLAVIFRLFFIVAFPGPNYYEGITGSYLEVAQNILEGRGMVTHVDIAPLGAAERQWSYEPFIDRPLGYVFLILVPLGIVSSPLGIQVFHALLAGCSALLLFSLGRRMFSESISWTGALWYVLWPLSARFEIAILPDGVMPFILILVLWMIVMGLSVHRSWLWYAGAGVVLGIGVTMRPDVLFLPFFIAAGFWLTHGRAHALRAGAILLVGVGFILTGHTWRNYQATDGRVLPLGLGNGISLWEGISQFGDTLGTVYGDERMALLEGYPSWGYPNGVDRDRKRFNEAVGTILDHPVWYMQVMLKRLPVLLTPDWIMTRRFFPPIRHYLDAAPGRSVFGYIVEYPVAALTRILVTVLQIGTLVLAAMALRKPWYGNMAIIPAAVIFYYIAVHIPTNTEARYFYPVIPLVLLLASAGWHQRQPSPGRR